ncbi:hypothetical protein ElyMa_001215800 [Elysia marginata]|uniref:Uncharacterized protein n=1 Tax=Elysia marginata TaxID=1093978 RepID=A0AAV4I7P7_9GAST|nr:hypothetical protein ElyMa_001215800 [Elysia marginata]
MFIVLLPGLKATVPLGRSALILELGLSVKYDIDSGKYLSCDRKEGGARLVSTIGFASLVLVEEDNQCIIKFFRHLLLYPYIQQEFMTAFDSRALGPATM